MNTAQTNDLSMITAVCVDTLNHELAIAACWNMSQHGFAEVLLLTDEAADAYLPTGEFTGFRVERIAPLRGRDAYSHYVLHSLASHIGTSHALIFQWDGYVLDARRWNPQYLEYDYVGAPFPWGRYANRRVGNGGFSLRSAKLMRAVAAMTPDSTEPEDRVICELLAERLETEHGLRFAPPELARHFSVDQMSVGNLRTEQPDLYAEETFGFHGFFNFHLAFDDFELLDLIDNRLGPFRNTLLTTQLSAMLIANLLDAGRDLAAGEIAMRCASLLGMDPGDVDLRELLVRLYRSLTHAQ